MIEIQIVGKQQKCCQPYLITIANKSSLLIINIRYNYDESADNFNIKTNVMRSTLRTEHSQATTQPNYKQLYLQTKRNVAVFMKHVDSELSSILKKNEAEKKQLEEQIQKLKEELKERDHSSFHFSKISSIKSTSKRSHSDVKMNTQASLPKQAVEECLARFGNIDLKSIQSSGVRQAAQFKFKDDVREKRALKEINESQKENKILPINFDDQFDLKHLNSVGNAPKRESRLKEKKVQQGGEKVENIKTLLKDLRGKISSRDKGSLRSKQDQISNIISPDLFLKVKN